MIKYIVGDTNGTFLSKNDNELTTNNLENVKVFGTIGQAMAECAEYNKGRISFVVIPYEVG